MAHPVPSYPYVLVNRSLLCNCHLQSGLMYLLKSLGSCTPNDRFTMYFTINSAFNHYMSAFGLPATSGSPDALLSQQHIFDIFLNDTSQPVQLPNTSDVVLPLDPLTLWWNCSIPLAHGPQSPLICFFSLLCGIPLLKILEKAHFCFLHQPTYCI